MELQELKAHKEKSEPLAPLVHRVTRALLEIRAQLEPKVLPVLLARKVIKAFKVLKV